MKKRAMSIILFAVMLLTMLPTTAMATTVTKVRLTITEPEVGASADFSAALPETASTMVESVTWSNLDSSDPVFRQGQSYTVTVKVKIKPDSSNTFGALSSINATVNGNAAKVSGRTETGITVQYTWPCLGGDKFDLRHASLRASDAAYTTAEADALWVGKQAYDVIVLDESTKPKIGYAYSSVFDDAYTDEQLRCITKLIVDFEPDLFANEDQKEIFAQYMIYLPNLKEIWLSDKVDVVQFVKDLKAGTESGSMKKWYWFDSTSFGTADATLCIPSSSTAAVKAALGSAPCFTIKVYDGDVYAAQKAGMAAAKDYCTSHSYTEIIMSADRAAHYADCSKATYWYYSCSVCGKCEYNANHTVNRGFDGGTTDKYSHQYDANLATEEAYIGVNAAGDQVYWKSCIYCSHSYNYHTEHITQEEWQLSGVDVSYAQYQQVMADTVAKRESKALAADTTQTDMFTISAKSDAKTSVWAQSDVNLAMDNDLLDTALLGGDYTKAISRLQFCSVAVRLAEELTGREIAAAPSGTFKDTDNLYVRKAYAAGITTGVSATAFDPNGTLNRQQMATFIYRALQYVEANSDYRYTDYVSKLASYSDSGQIKAWAKEAMAFMNALDLIKGTSATTLAPNATCTIEQAVAVAYRSIYAHQIGWYQAVKETQYMYTPGSDITAVTLSIGDRVWVTGNRIGSGVKDTTLDNLAGKYSASSCYFPVADPYTGQIHYVKCNTLKPIRD